MTRSVSSAGGPGVGLDWRREGGRSGVECRGQERKINGVAAAKHWVSLDNNNTTIITLTLQRR